MAKEFKLQEKDEELIKGMKIAHGRIEDRCMIIWDFDDASSYRDIINEKNIYKIIIDVECGIPRETFSHCNTIQEVFIRPGVTYIGEGAFEDCKELRRIEIANGVTRIEKDAFSGCEHLTEVIIPDSVTDLGILAFYLCHNLRHITLSKNITSIGWKTFRECQNLQSIKIPNGVTQIGQYAFQDCCGLVSVEIPDSVTYLDIGAFSGCSSLVSATCNGVTAIMNYAFQDCSSLQTVMIGDNIKEIGYGAFFGCCNLKEVSLPSGIGYTKKYVFGTSKCKIIKRHIKEAEMANYLRFNQLEEGNFYYVLEHNDEPENQFVWYKRDGHLKNPRCCSDTLNTSEDYHYYPLTLDKVDEFDEWMEENGDCIGRIAWTAYKMKLRETEMTKKNETKKSEKDVDLYDPKFVYFDWDVNLKGKRVFFANAIDYLKIFVRNNDKSRYYKIAGLSDDPAWPFFIDNESWKFVYYDPNYEVKWAYFKEGKTIQMRRGSIDSWEDIYPWGKSVAVRGPEYFDDVYQYRIKPEEKQKPNVEVNVDVKVSNLPDEKVEITINGKKCVFENAEQAKKVLFDGE